jgi:hypothetical protein
MTMTAQQETVTDPGVAEATLPQRVAKGVKSREDVVIRTVWDNQHIEVVGKVGKIATVDETDPRLTFNVSVEGYGPAWVHDVEPVTLGPIDSEANMGDKVVALKVENVAAAENRIGTVMNGSVIGDSLVLRVKFDQAVTGDGGVTDDTWMVKSWRRVIPTLDGVDVPEVTVLGPSEAQEKIQTLQDDLLSSKSLVAALEQQRDAANANLQREIEARRAAQAALTRFQEQVRDVAIRVAEEQSWCDNGLNEVLEELGLERKEKEYEVEVRVEGWAYVTVTVTATNDDEAGEKAIEEIENGNQDTSDLDWNVESTEVHEVSEA